MIMTVTWIEQGNLARNYRLRVKIVKGKAIISVHYMGIQRKMTGYALINHKERSYALSFL